MPEIVSGKVWKYGSNINTDIISPPEYMEMKMEDAAKYAMSTVDPTFASNCRPGDLLVAENNLGSGSSRETAPLTLRILGIHTIVAKSYARIFYRNCINLGIMTIVCPETEKISMGDHIEVDFVHGRIYNQSKDETYSCDPIPEYILPLLKCGGLVEYLRQKIQGQ